MTTAIPTWLEWFRAVGKGLGGVAAFVALVPKAVKKWHDRNRGPFHVTLVRTARGSAHLVVRNQGSAAMRGFFIHAKYSSPDRVPLALKGLKVALLEAGEDMQIPILFLPEVGVPPLVVTITTNSRSALETEFVRRLWWRPWTELRGLFS